MSKKQLIIKLPEEYCQKEFPEYIKYINQQFAYGYPLIIPKEWEYEVIKIDEPMVDIDSHTNNYRRFENALNEMQSNKRKVE